MEVRIVVEKTILEDQNTLGRRILSIEAPRNDEILEIYKRDHRYLYQRVRHQTQYECKELVLFDGSQYESISLYVGMVIDEDTFQQRLDTIREITRHMNQIELERHNMLKNWRGSEQFIINGEENSGE